MKVSSAILTTVLLLTLTAGTAYAETASSPASLRAQRQQQKIQLKDQRKAQIVQNMDTKMDNLNKNRTDLMTRHLSKMSTILSKLQSIVNKAQQNGKDVTAANTAIAKAQTAISAAQTAVNTQSGKSYQINATSDTTVKANAQVTVTQLRNDLKSTQQQVVSARQALANAISVTRSTLKGAGNAATSSAVKK